MTGKRICFGVIQANTESMYSEEYIKIHYFKRHNIVIFEAAKICSPDS